MKRTTLKVIQLNEHTDPDWSATPPITGVWYTLVFGFRGVECKIDTTVRSYSSRSQVSRNLAIQSLNDEITDTMKQMGFTAGTIRAAIARRR